MAQVDTDVQTYVSVSEVDYIDRVAPIGRIFRARVPIRTLADLLRRSVVLYSPRYQRGFKKLRGDTVSDYDRLLPINDPQLQVDQRRSEDMAVKFLQGKLFNGEVVWNARSEGGERDPNFDAATKSLRIYTQITIPDSAHRHLTYFLLDLWKRDPSKVPASVTVDQSPVSRDDITEALRSFDPAQEFVFVSIFSVTAEHEGWLYDQLNFDQKPPQRSVGITLNPEKTPARRFVSELMRASPVFAEEEIETRSNSIGTDSRKLTTNSTLVGAVEPFRSLLVELEENRGSGGYDDLVAYVAAFFDEYSKIFPAFQPGASALERNELRDESFALSNVVFHPLMRLAFELWGSYRTSGQDWRQERQWRAGIAALAQTVTSEGLEVPLMSRGNREWDGKIVIARYGPEGQVLERSVSNTRQTRDSAYQYMLKKTALAATIKPRRSNG